MNAVNAAPTLQEAWVARYNNTTIRASHEAVAVALDSAGNVVVAGNSPGSNDKSDYATLKYNPQGQLLWQNRYDSSTNGNDLVRAMVVDANGNVALTGTAGTVKLGPDGRQQWIAPYAGTSIAGDGEGNFYVTGLFSTYYFPFRAVTSAFVVVKLTASGQVAWQGTHMPSASGGEANAVALGPEGSVFVAGTFIWYCHDRAGCYNQPGVAKFDATGTLEWFAPKELTTPPRMQFAGFSVDSLGRPIVAVNVTPDLGFQIKEWTAQGGAGWEAWLGGTLPPFPATTALAVTLDQEIVVAGSRVVVHQGRAFRRYLTLKMDPSGQNLWEATAGGPTGNSYANAIATDSSGNVFVTGASPGAGPAADIFTVQYDGDGRLLRELRAANSTTNNSVGRAIAVDRTGNLYVAGAASNGEGTDLVVIKYAYLENFVREPNGTFTLQFFGIPGQVYRLEATSDFAAWSELTSATADAAGIVQFTTTATPPQRFYRRTAAN